LKNILAAKKNGINPAFIIFIYLKYDIELIKWNNYQGKKKREE